MALSLYYSEPSAAMGVRVLLEEIGVPYDLVWTNISSDSIRDPQLLALNPNGWIPILVWKEGLAIVKAYPVPTRCCRVTETQWNGLWRTWAQATF